MDGEGKGQDCVVGHHKLLPSHRSQWCFITYVPRRDQHVCLEDVCTIGDLLTAPSCADTCAAFNVGRSLLRLEDQYLNTVIDMLPISPDHRH